VIAADAGTGAYRAGRGAAVLPQWDPRDRRRTHKLDFNRRLVAVAAEAGAADPRQLGEQLAVLFEGASAMATSVNDPAPAAQARAAAATLIDAAVGS
jgi:hypothetical protein